MNEKKLKLIIDTDPGVDDTVCLIYALFSEKVDVKLLSTVAGNVSIEKATRNLLHLLDILDVDVSVAKGSDVPMERISENAEFIHQESGLGGYTPKGQTKHKVVTTHAVDEIYRIISNGDGDIIPLVLGPQTNFGLLIKKYPDVVNKIPLIAFMGGSPYGVKGYPDHISFNISFDPEAFKIVLDSKIPLLMLPSNVGRRIAHLDEKYVDGLKEINDVGKLMNKMYSMYWEPNFPDKRVATNDVCALLALTHPEIFTTEKVNVTVNLTDAPGKTLVEFTKDGQVDLVTGVDREAFLNLLNTELSKLNHIKIDF
ncbi:MAG: hypothetical protein E7373_01565 [Clostridiales bacterium]|nr:hypothetical protein [Clostridiales bacterium]